MTAGPSTILIVDDEPQNRKLLETLLAPEGYLTRCAATGEEALASIAQQAPDLILLDVMMPGMDGYEVARTLKANPAAANIPIIMVTAAADRSARLAGLTAGAEEFLAKPVERAELWVRVRNLLRLKAFNDFLKNHSMLLEEQVQARTSDLQASESRFRQMAENIRDVFFLKDAATNRMLYVSPAYEEIWGRSCESLYANPESWTDAIHPDDLAVTHEKFMEGMSTGKYIVEYRIVRPDGSIRWIRTKDFVVHDTAGKIVRVAGIAEDVTESRRAMEELRESERRFSDVLQNVELISLMLDREARIVYCNEYLLRLTGWRREEVIGQSWFELFIPPETSGLKEVHAALVANKPEARHHENEILTRSGGRRLIRWNNSVLRSGASDVIGTASLGEDITEQRQAEVKIKRLNRVYAVLSGINTLIVRATDREELFREANRIAVEQGGFRLAWIGVVDREAGLVRPVASAGDVRDFFDTAPLELLETGPGRFGLAGRVVATMKPIVLNDAQNNPRTLMRKQIAERGIKSLAIIPLVIDGNTTGVLALYAADAGFFDDQEMLLLLELAGDISFAIDHIEKAAKLGRITRVNAMLSGINAAIVRIRDSGELFREFCRIAVSDGGFILARVVELDSNRMASIAATSESDSRQFQHLLDDYNGNPGRAQSQNLFELAVHSGRPEISNDVASDPRISNAATLTTNGTYALAVMPITVEKRLVGTVVLRAREAGMFNEEELRLLLEVISNISFALELMDKNRKLDYLAYYDALTGLANRRLFLERITQYMRSAVTDGHKLAVGLIDLERFKNINDSLGRPAGDALLKQVAEWLTGNLGDANLSARVGSDHFAVVLPEVRSEGNLARLVEKMMADFLEHPFHLNDTAFRIATKVGVALFPDDGADADILLKNAEAALKKAKATGEKYLFYTQKMTETVAGKLTLENQLRQALDKGEFVLHYQPKVNLVSGKLTGVEALIRWNDPRTGLVPPGQFIPLLEETGLIYDVGRWALGKAIKDYLRWRAAGLSAVRVAVNVSPLQLRNRSFTAEIEQAIGIDPHAAAGLELEITESLIMEDVKHNIASLQTIRAMGIKIAIDDFGTGFSSLAYLAKLPVDTLKIDRSFVIDMADGPEGLALVSTIINLAHSLKLKVVAEGVETEEQLRLLRLLDCDEMQGYLFSKPVPSEILEAKYLGPETDLQQALVIEPA